MAIKQLLPSQFSFENLSLVLPNGQPPMRWSEWAPKAKAAIPALTKMLDGKNFNLFCMAARALGSIGPDAISVKDKLIAKAKTGNSSERGRAMEALGGMGAIDDKDVAELFKTGISADYLNVRDMAMIGIGLSKEKAKGVHSAG